MVLLSANAFSLHLSQNFKVSPKCGNPVFEALFAVPNPLSHAGRRRRECIPTQLANKLREQAGFHTYVHIGNLRSVRGSCYLGAWRSSKFQLFLGTTRFLSHGDFNTMPKCGITLFKFSQSWRDSSRDILPPPFFSQSGVHQVPKFPPLFFRQLSNWRWWWAEGEEEEEEERRGRQRNYKEEKKKRPSSSSSPLTDDEKKEASVKFAPPPVGHKQQKRTKFFLRGK